MSDEIQNDARNGESNADQESPEISDPSTDDKIEPGCTAAAQAAGVYQGAF